MSDIKGTIDTTYHTQQRDMFASGLAAQIGTDAFGVWSAVKSHADFKTGEAWPGVRKLMEMTGLANSTVQKAIETLLKAHLLRLSRVVGRKHYYVARERLDVRVGSRVICTIAVDYIPASMRERLAKLQSAALEGDWESEDIWADVDIYAGPGFDWDPEKKSLRGKLRADEVPALPVSEVARKGIAEAKALADRIRLVHSAPPTRS